MRGTTAATTYRGHPSKYLTPTSRIRAFFPFTLHPFTTIAWVVVKVVYDDMRFTFCSDQLRWRHVIIEVNNKCFISFCSHSNLFISCFTSVVILFFFLSFFLHPEFFILSRSRSQSHCSFFHVFSDFF